MNDKSYPSDLTDAQWEIIQGLIPKKQGRGRNRKVDLRRVVDGIFYRLRSSSQHRMLPHDFPPWQTVDYYFYKWQADGTWERIHDALRQQVRQQDRPTARTTASVDSQSTDSSGTREDRGFDGGKKLDGRKRHIIVDSLGLLLAVAITAGNVSDAAGGIACLKQMDAEQYPQVETIFADRAYEKGGFPEKVREWKPSCALNVIARPENTEGFAKLPIRWVVERTNAWLTKNRRLCRSYEHTSRSEEAYVKLAMIHRMLRRLSPSPTQAPFCFRKAA